MDSRRDPHERPLHLPLPHGDHLQAWKVHTHRRIQKYKHVLPANNFGSLITIDFIGSLSHPTCVSKDLLRP